MRPFLRWFLFTACLAVFTAAMLWISARILDLEGQRQRTAEEAQVQEKVRLALWRMDSLASALLIRENSRPAWHYQAFYAPDDLFASSTKSIPKGQALMPSPLFGSLPDLVQLHFEIVGGASSSPQAPVGQQRELASNWYATTPQTSQATTKLNQLRELIKKHPEVQRPAAVSEAPSKPVPADEEKAKTAELKKDQGDAQMAFNALEQTQRAQIITRNLVTEKAEISNAPMKKIAPVPGAAAKPEIADTGSSTRTGSPMDKVKDLYRGTTRAKEPNAPGAPASAAMLDSFSAAPATPAAPAPVQRQFLPGLAGDLRAVWADQELLLVRQASLEGLSRLQGVWLDWPLLQTRLLETVRDLLPEARLMALSPESARTDANALVTLPVKLLTGNVPITALSASSPLKPALGIAWACLIAAALAIAFVLHRAVLLSERRGAFVSAVTHELRTPLTTFRLYSEMLADDMVPDAGRRREYLTTLCDESTRLMHLVENVLSFSRIERGRTAARMERVGVTSLLQRIEPRLRQRTDQVGLTLTTQIEPDASLASVQVDALAVEQILFNLTDNACKYAAPDSQPHELHLSAVAEAKEVRFTLRDFGPGLSKQARKKLFQPFAKSATEAAHSAPGVGLRLALCRRLARELGGRLTHESTSERGASFCLSLPRQPL
jgi:signal transduction histidine kinase